MNLGQLISGLFFLVVGIVLLVFTFLESFFLIIYALICLVIGGAILANSKEDVIEKIKK